MEQNEPRRLIADIVLTPMPEIVWLPTPPQGVGNPLGRAGIRNPLLDCFGIHPQIGH